MRIRLRFQPFPSYDTVSLRLVITVPAYAKKRRGEDERARYIADYKAMNTHLLYATPILAAAMKAATPANITIRPCRLRLVRSVVIR